MSEASLDLCDILGSCHQTLDMSVQCDEDNITQCHKQFRTAKPIPSLEFGATLR